MRVKGVFQIAKTRAAAFDVQHVRLMQQPIQDRSRQHLASARQNGAVRGPQPEATARKSGRRLTRNVPRRLTHGAEAVRGGRVADREAWHETAPVPGAKCTSGWMLTRAGSSRR